MVNIEANLSESGSQLKVHPRGEYLTAIQLGIRPQIKADYRVIKNWHFINIQNINDNTKPLSAIPYNDIIACLL